MTFVRRSRALEAGSAIILLAGIWTIVSGYVLGGIAGAEWTGTVVGILFIVCSSGRLLLPRARAFSVGNIVWSIWLIISPWVIPSRLALHWSSDATGIVVLILAIIETSRMPPMAALPVSGAGPAERAA